VEPAPRSTRRGEYARAAALVALLSAPAYAGMADPSAVPPRGIEGPDVRAHDRVEGIEGPDVRARHDGR